MESSQQLFARAAQHPPAFEQLEYCWPWNIGEPNWDPPIDPILFGQLRLSPSQQSKERIITGAGLAQPGKSYHAVRTDEFNWRTSEDFYVHVLVIASIEAPLKSADWRSKFVIFQTCATFFWNLLVALCRAGGPGPFAPYLIGGYIYPILVNSTSK
jgi:hypothetical protein